NILATMMSWFGPFWFLSRPTISIGTASGSVPWKTVHAIPLMPGFTSFRRMISTGPAMGREGGASAAGSGRPTAANTNTSAADRMFIGDKLQLYPIVQRGAGALACAGPLVRLFADLIQTPFLLRHPLMRIMKGGAGFANFVDGRSTSER